MFTLVRNNNPNRLRKRQPPSSQTTLWPPLQQHDVPTGNVQDIRDLQQPTLRSASSLAVYPSSENDFGAALARTSTAGSTMSGKAAALLGMHEAPLTPSTPAPSSTPVPISQKPPKNWLRRPGKGLRSHPSSDSLRTTPDRDSLSPMPSIPEKSRPVISKPTNFQHLAHTQPHHFNHMTSKSANDLLADFSAVRAGQRPQRDLQGIKAASINLEASPSRCSSVNESEPSAGLGSVSTGCERDSAASSNTSYHEDDAQSQTLPAGSRVLPTRPVPRPPSTRTTSTFSRNSFNGFDKDSRLETSADEVSAEDANGTDHSPWTGGRDNKQTLQAPHGFTDCHAISTAGDVAAHPYSPDEYASLIRPLFERCNASASPMQSNRPNLKGAKTYTAASSRAACPPEGAKNSDTLGANRVLAPRTPQTKSSEQVPARPHISEQKLRNRQGLITLWTPSSPAPAQPARGRQADHDEPSNVGRPANFRSRMSMMPLQHDGLPESRHAAALKQGPFEVIKGRRGSDDQTSQSEQEEEAELDDWLANEFAGHNIKYQPFNPRRATVISTLSSTNRKSSYLSRSPTPEQQSSIHAQPPVLPPLIPLPPIETTVPKRQTMVEHTTAESPTWAPPVMTQKRKQSALRVSKSSLSKKVSFTPELEEGPLSPAPLSPAPLSLRKKSTQHQAGAFPAQSRPSVATCNLVDPTSRPQLFSPELSPTTTLSGQQSPSSIYSPVSSCGSFVTKLGSHQFKLADEAGRL